MKIPKKLDNSKLPDNFKKQIIQQQNELIDYINDLHEEIKKLKKYTNYLNNK